MSIRDRNSPFSDAARTEAACSVLPLALGPNRQQDHADRQQDELDEKNGRRQRKRRVQCPQGQGDVYKRQVMIHELVHQWWGLGNMFDASDESSLWSAEGLTVYTTYRIVKERYGPSYAQEHYCLLYTSRCV